jgi:hypothetical protein
MRVVAFAAGAAIAVALLSLSGCTQRESAGSGSGGGSSTGSGSGGGGAPLVLPAWLSAAQILVSGETTNNDDCTTGVCRHSENTDLINWNNAIWLVHRTAESQILGPDSSLRVSKSIDGGKTFTVTAVIPAPQPTDGGSDPTGRDIRDPHFFVVGNKLTIKTLCRLAQPIPAARDSNVDTLPQMTESSDGVTWSPLTPITNGMGTAWDTHSFWRIKQQGGVYYAAAYLDGDMSVTLFSSNDGVAWTKGAEVYTVSADTPLETELTFMPSGKLLALVRMDGTDAELLGDVGRLRTKVCWADPPYASFLCPQELTGYRLDGPLSFFHGGRLFVVARKHLPGLDDRKRTALYEITGTLEGGPLSIQEWGELPSAGDTSYAGVATIDADHALVSWYSGNLQKDEGWLAGMLDVTDIWQATLDFTKLK